MVRAVAEAAMSGTGTRTAAGTGAGAAAGTGRGRARPVVGAGGGGETARRRGLGLGWQGSGRHRAVATPVAAGREASSVRDAAPAARAAVAAPAGAGVHAGAAVRSGAAVRGGAAVRDAAAPGAGEPRSARVARSAPTVPPPVVARPPAPSYARPQAPPAPPFTHPTVKPALRRAWRDLGTVQFGMTRAHASVLGPLDPGSASLLRLLDGTRGVPLLYAEGARNGLSPADVDRLLDTLAGSGLLEDATGGSEAAREVRQDAELMDRLRPDLASLALLDRRPAGAAEALAGRTGARVLVRGAGRVGAAIAALLAAAGVGAVEVMDGGRVEPADVSPAGLPPNAVGARRAEAARRLMSESAPSGRRRSRPEPAAGRLGEAPPPDLVVLAPRDAVSVHAPDPQLAEPLIAAGIPHLYAGVVETTGLVGPLVLPGRTACAGCLERHRIEREAGHARLLAQWRSGRTHRVEPLDLSLATTVAALTASHALSLLDGHLPTTVGERWETSLPTLAWTRHHLPTHPHCPCGAGTADNWPPSTPRLPEPNQPAPAPGQTRASRVSTPEMRALGSITRQT